MYRLPPTEYLPHTKDAYKMTKQKSHREMRYYDEPCYVWKFNEPDWCPAVHFCPMDDYSITDGYRVIELGFIVENYNYAPVRIYFTSKSETEPNCSPDIANGIGWEATDYGPINDYVGYS